MSDVKTAQEETFTSKLDIHMVSTKTYEEMVEMHADTPRAVITAIGVSGIGKTAIPKQVARKRNAPYAALHLPTMSVEDFHIPTTAVDTKKYYDKRIPRKFQELIDYVEREKSKNGGVFPKGKNPILAIEELNRAVDKHVTRATFTLLDDRMVGDVYLDDAIQLVVTMNPTGGGMAVNEFEKDPAMRRRLIMIGVACSYGDFIEHARKAEFHPKVLEHLDAQPMLIYDHAGAASGKKFACPAAWDTASRLCYTLDRNKVPLTSAASRAAIAGAVGSMATELFLEFVQDASVVITPDEVLKGYFAKSTVRDRFNKLIKDDKLDKVQALASNMVMKLLDGTRQPHTITKQLSLFMADMPEEVMIAFIRELGDQSKTARGGHKFFTDLSAIISKDKDFNTAVERMQAAQSKGKAAAKREKL